MNTSVNVCRLGALLGVVLLVACGGPQTRIDGRQYVAVKNPEQPKNVMLVLGSYSGCAPEDRECRDRLPVLAKLQAEFESCIDSGLGRTAPQVTLVRHARWGESADLERLIAELAAGKPVSADRLAPAEIGFELDYLVSIGVEKSSSDKEFVAEIVAADPGAAAGPIIIPPTVVWGFGQQWTNTAAIKTRVFSARTGKLTGELSADLTEDAFWVLPVITVIPLVPISWSPDVETKSCKEMGEALGRFFSGAGNQYLE